MRHFLCASAGMSPHDTKYKKNKYYKKPRGVRGAERLNQRCIISSCSGLDETDIYRYIEVTHCSLNKVTRCPRFPGTVPVFGDLSLDKAVPENDPDFDTDWGENVRRLEVTPVTMVAI